jgi:hypothetical protein
MTTKTIDVADTTRTQLDWLVAKAEGHIDDVSSWLYQATVVDVADSDSYHPSEKWAQGGPIIEREGIATREIPPVSGGNEYIFTRRWIAEIFRFPGGPRRSVAYGTTPLVAAMRCYVASHLGNEIEIPEELT